MKMILFQIALIILFTTCTTKKSNSPFSLVISGFNKRINTSGQPEMPKHPFSYYGHYNFIFDTSGKIYFYQNEFDTSKKHKRVIDFDNQAPVYLGLTPDRLCIVPEMNILQFAKANFSQHSAKTKFLVISSVSDTINSDGLFTLLQLAKDTSFHLKIDIRRTTYEENLILKYKIANSFFDPNAIHWDSTEVLFLHR
jgi:hypothetical protein